MRYFEMFTGVAGFSVGIERAYANHEYAHISTEPESEERSQGRFGAADKRRVQLQPRDGSAPFCIGFSEIDRDASAVLRYRYPAVRNYGDARNIVPAELPDFDLLCAGFPCQSFSIAGKRQGFDDTRGTLFFEIARVLSHKRPRHFILENVRGLVSHERGKTLARILGVLTDLNYHLECTVLNSKNFGVPQNRERIFFIGHLGGECAGEILSFGSDDRTADELPRYNANCLTARYYGAQTTGTYIGELDPQMTQLDETKGLADAHRVYDGDGLARTLKGEGGGLGAKTGLYKLVNGKQGCWVYDDHGTAAALRRCGGTATDKYAIDSRIRRLTPIECARLQAFPDDWADIGIDDKGKEYRLSDTAKYRCFGNAVTGSVIEALVRRMKEVGCLA